MYGANLGLSKSAVGLCRAAGSSRLAASADSRSRETPFLVADLFLFFFFKNNVLGRVFFLIQILGFVFGTAVGFRIWFRLRRKLL